MQPEMRIRVKMVMIDSSEKNGISKEGACGETRRRTIQGTIGEEGEREREEGGGWDNGRQKKFRRTAGGPIPLDEQGQ